MLNTGHEENMKKYNEETSTVKRKHQSVIIIKPREEKGDSSSEITNCKKEKSRIILI